jgi:hypothetical protein
MTPAIGQLYIGLLFSSGRQSKICEDNKQSLIAKRGEQNDIFHCPGLNLFFTEIFHTFDYYIVIRYYNPQRV